MYQETAIPIVPAAIQEEVLKAHRRSWFTIAFQVFLLCACIMTMYISSIKVLIIVAGIVFACTLFIFLPTLYGILTIRKRLTAPGIRYSGTLTDKYIQDYTLEDAGRICYYFCFGESRIELHGNPYTNAKAFDLFLCYDVHEKNHVALDIYPQIGYTGVPPDAFPQLQQKQAVVYTTASLTAADRVVLHQKKNKEIEKKATAGHKETAMVRILYREESLSSMRTVFGKVSKEYSYKLYTKEGAVSVSKDVYNRHKAGNLITICRLPGSDIIWTV